MRRTYWVDVLIGGALALAVLISVVVLSSPVAA